MKLVAKIPFHYGWMIVLSGALTLFACLGLARFAFGLLLPAMHQALSLGYDQMGLISTGNFVGYLISVALSPLLIRRFGPRAVICAGLLLVFFSMLLISRSQTLGALTLFYGLVGAGSGFANIPTMVLVSHWFRRNKRGLAAGLIIAGNGMAIIVAGLAVPAINAAYGWRSSWLGLALVSLLAAAVALLVVRNDPAELGLEPYGQFEAVRTGDFQAHAGTKILLQLGIIYLIFGLTYMVYGTFIVTTMVDEFGFSEAAAGRLWSWVGFFGLFSGVVFGTVSDRIGRRNGMVLVYGMFTCAYLLAGFGGHLGAWALWLSVICYGSVLFAVPTIMAAAVTEYLGLERAASGFSALTLFFAAGQIIGPGSAGLLAEISKTFVPSYLVSAGLTALAILLTLKLKNPQA
ncbi:MFS transporter [Geopsychrobacter electrodiphilus]|uniref:MFS transporter n=1 Tax=Geopsychrobacter electrodiphilus TaxID=225196 RepID=UPI0003751ED3|nr:MFS transporter [Geopsychrobacter electrodiphilus]